MRQEIHFFLTALNVLLLLILLSFGSRQSLATKPTAQEKESYVNFPGLPTCTSGLVRNGDPATGPNIVQVKADADCVIPWHWHTPNENVMMVSGVARMEMKDAKTITLKAGSYTMMPSKHLHQFTCKTSCSFFVYSDTAFDIHYVDASGKEIPADEALKPFKESAAKETK